MTAATKATAPNGTEPSKGNVHQRIAAVTAAVGNIAKGSLTQQGKKAVGIEDVEEALAPVLADHGLVTEWSYVDLCTRDDWKCGNESVYQAKLRVAVVNVDDPTDRIEAEWTDTGSNPMASTSFTRKGYYKALFHLAAAGDEGETAAGRGGQQGRQDGQQRDGKPQRRTTRSVPIEGRACPECGDQLAIVYRDNGGAFIGHTPYRRDGCQWRPDPDLERELRAAAPPDPDPPPAGPPPADDPVVMRIIEALHKLTPDQQRMVFTDQRWARTEGEPVKLWIGRLNAATRLMLTAAIGTFIPPAPEPEASKPVTAPQDAPAPHPSDVQQETMPV